MDGEAAERHLRLEAERVIDTARHLPAADAAAALDALDAAATAAVRAGVVAPDRGAAVVSEVVDALVLRGASWLEPARPDLDVARLYAAAAGGRAPTLRRVVPVVARLDDDTITSVELWSDRVVARVVDDEGRVAASHVVGAAGVGDRRLDLRDASGGVVGVDLTGGRPAREVPGVVVAATVERHLDRLAVLEAVRARGAGSVEALNGARRRIEAAAAVLGAPPGPLLDRFDALAAAGAPAGSALVEVVAVAQRFFGGWLSSLERWQDHWRAVVVPEEAAPGPAPAWTAFDEGGRRYGASAIDGETLRFEPALAAGWSRLVLERHDAGGVLEVEVTR